MSSEKPVTPQETHSAAAIIIATTFFQLFFILKNLLQLGLYLSSNVLRAFPGGALSSWGNEIVSRPSHLRDPAARPPSVPFLRLMGIIRAEYGVFRLKKRASARLSAKVVPFFSYTGCAVILRFRARFPGFRHISVTLIFGTHRPPSRRFFPIIAQHFDFVNPENTIQNGFFTPVSPFLAKSGI